MWGAHTLSGRFTLPPLTRHTRTHRCTHRLQHLAVQLLAHVVQRHIHVMRVTGRHSSGGCTRSLLCILGAVIHDPARGAAVSRLTGVRTVTFAARGHTATASGWCHITGWCWRWRWRHVAARRWYWRRWRRCLSARRLHSSGGAGGTAVAAGASAATSHGYTDIRLDAGYMTRTCRPQRLCDRRRCCGDGSGRRHVRYGRGWSRRWCWGRHQPPNRHVVRDRFTRVSAVAVAARERLWQVEQAPCVIGVAAGVKIVQLVERRCGSGHGGGRGTWRGGGAATKRHRRAYSHVGGGV